MRKLYQICLFLLFLISWMSIVHAKPQVVATTSDLGSLVSEIGKDKVSVTTISKPTEDPHFVDAKPGFIVKLNRADMLINGGLMLEAAWLPPLVLGARNVKIQPGNPGYMNAAAGIDVLEVPSVANRAMGDIHPLGNPHFMLDPANAKIVAAHISGRLCQIDKKNCEYYRNNAATFSKKLNQKLSEWQKILEPFQGTKIVTYHKTFPYFAKRFHFNVVGTLEPKPGIPPSPAHLNTLIPMMQKEDVKLILIENFRERKIPEFAASRTNAKVVIVPIMVEGEKGTDNYIALFDYIINEIASALKT
ncbi:MAG: zinc ABC transporter substrate-binding protein [wastewater metagenome]|nr:zinc ABC transporter substrate-binding protein [Candidatus Loosdrechtia aerotolerans]